MITDERIAKFIDTCRAMGDAGDGARYDWWDNLAAALTELQSLRSKPVAGVEVKPLEWGSKHEDATGYLSYDAKSVLGTYSIYRIKNGGVWSCERGVVNIGQFSSETEAKAAAEADYRQRILSALLPKATAPVVSEPVAWRWKHPLWPDKHWQYGTHDPRIGTDDGVDPQPLYASPQPEVVITEEMVERMMSWVREDVLPAYDVTHNTRASDPEMVEGCRAALTSAMKEA